MSKSIEILRYLRFSPDGTSKLRVRGELYESVSDIPDERVQKVIKRSIATMVDMAGGIEQLIEDGYLSAPVVLVPADPADATDFENRAEFVPTVVPPPTSLPVKEVKEIEEDPVAAEPAQKTGLSPTEPPVEPPTQAIDPAETVPLPKLSQDFGLSLDDTTPSLASQSFLTRLRGLRGRTPNNEVLGPPPDIASQINSILQGLIEQDPSFIGRRVEMRSAGKGELVFVVDGQYFESVSEITDPSAAQIIRSAISTWENR